LLDLGDEGLSVERHGRLDVHAGGVLVLLEGGIQVSPCLCFAPRD
jgi:hypothetical protein